ncbi:MAG: hypothetical protein KME32_35130 [Mojavia pulchra JT2-VF2]|jgi:hypothetical protein|uniref:Uncharacterized protein n=1 Tax=Mojavia pulchra JT2-VF2 TaxID=287848 RepID=A0A951Q545_9NOST|nr:hypothetical protein [Mojavia pulchra JT2-VF2]
MKSEREILIDFMQILGQYNPSSKQYECFFKLKNGQECDGDIEAIHEKYLQFYPWYYSQEWQHCGYEKQFLRDEDDEDEDIDFILIPLNDIDLTNLYYWNEQSCCFISLEWNVTQNCFIHNETVPGSVPLPTYLQEDIPEDDKRLKEVGYWQSDSNRPYYPHPKHLLKQRWRKSERNQIIDYLKAGHICGARHDSRSSFCNFDCFSRDRFEKLNQIEERKLTYEMLKMGTCDLLSDGEWIWPIRLAHYIEKHDIYLPDEFILTMQKNSWSVPQNIDFQHYWQLGANESFWINWAIKYTQTNQT